MKKIQLEIVGLSHSFSSHHSYTVLLEETLGTRRLPIVIGAFEAQAIAVVLEGMIPSRPLTHDLMCNLLQTFEISVREVIIHDYLDGIFYAQLICNKNGETVHIDCRTSDSLALAIRLNAPIYTLEKIINMAGIDIDDKNVDDMEADDTPPPMFNPNQTHNEFDNFSTEELTTLLEQVLQNEDYKKAAAIRDELTKRKENL